MAIGLNDFLQALCLAFTRQTLSIRRGLIFLIVLFLLSLFFYIVLIGRFLDDLFFRGYRRQKIDSPVFIISTPRSGTTLLHRLMCLDESRFTYFRTYQTLLPAVSLYKTAGLLAAIDRRTGRVLTRLKDWIDRLVFSIWKNIHPTGLTQAEEDEGLFLYTLHTPAIYLLMPFIDEIPKFRFSDQLDAKHRRRLMDYYRSCIQRHLYADGSGRTLLSKNVFSSGRLLSLIEAFPDARFIYIIRHPYQAIPSLLSMFYVIWKGHSPELAKDSPETSALANLGIQYYQHVLIGSQAASDHRFLCVSYDELVKDPGPVVENIYTHFDLTMNEGFRLALKKACNGINRHRPIHRYSLEEYGLKKEMIYENLKDVFDTFGFQKE